MSTIRGVRGLLGGASTTTGFDVRGALILGARLRLRDLNGMPDMSALLLLLRLGVKLEEALDGVEGS
jgi:hypothetical protein